MGVREAGMRGNSMRIGDVAERTGLTTRTIRYYEEVGLLPADTARPKGKHRHYDEADVAQLTLVHALSSLLSLSLDEIRDLVHPELGAAVTDERWEGIDDVAERLGVVESALADVTALLELVRSRRELLLDLQLDLEDRLSVIESRRVIGA